MSLFIKLAQENVTDVPCDVLFLKHADAFYGADAHVASRVGFDESLHENEWVFLPGRGLQAKTVLFGGVGPLMEFRYEAIRMFARAALQQIGEHYPETQTVACTIHGPGYGLDEREAFHALLAGLLDGAADAKNVREIQIVELDGRRVRRLEPLLRAALGLAQSSQRTEEIIRPNFSSVGRESERKPRLFVAMPFADQFTDEFEIAFMEAAEANGFLCERADLAPFVGDVMQWVRRAIETSDGVIALLNNANPNVFLEIGYAWAKNIPTILIVRSDQQPPFDVRTQRFIQYASISELRRKLKAEIATLKEQGVFADRRHA